MEDYGDDMHFGDSVDPSLYLDVLHPPFGPPRPRRFSPGDKMNKGISCAGLPKRTKKEVDSWTTQKGRTSTLPEDFVHGYYPNANSTLSIKINVAHGSLSRA